MLAHGDGDRFGAVSLNPYFEDLSGGME